MQIFSFPSQPLGAPFDCLNLDFETRSKSRFKAQLLTTGEEIGVLVPRGTVLRGGTLLVDGQSRVVEVVAADEPLLRVEASAFELMRCAYHLGNRHVRIALTPHYLQIRSDAVLADMLRLLGVTPQAVWAAFEAEVGAYGGGHQHGHDATFEEDYALAQEAFRVRSMTQTPRVGETS